MPTIVEMVKFPLNVDPSSTLIDKDTYSVNGLDLELTLNVVIPHLLLKDGKTDKLHPEPLILDGLQLIQLAQDIGPDPKTVPLDQKEKKNKT